MPEFVNYEEMVLFTYSTTHLTKTNKVRFYYALKGRDGQSGVVKQYEVVHLGKTVLMVPGQYSQEIREFLNLWGCVFDEKEVLVKK